MTVEIQKREGFKMKGIYSVEELAFARSYKDHVSIVDSHIRNGDQVNCCDGSIIDTQAVIEKMDNGIVLDSHSKANRDNAHNDKYWDELNRVSLEMATYAVDNFVTVF